MESINYFGLVILEILENKLLKNYFGNLKYTYQQIDATNGYAEVLNIKLNIWLDIPSKYIEDFCVIISVAQDIFSERLTNTSCQYFSIWFFPFL